MMTRPLLMALCVGITCLSLLAMLFQVRVGPFGSGWFKMIASTGFIGLAVAAGGVHTGFGRIMLLALFFSWWGDFFLIFGADRIFLMGVSAFFLGHVFFGAAFLWAGVDIKVTALAALVLAIPALAMLYWLYPHLGSMRIPVIAYIIVISLMVAISSGASFHQRQWWWLAGALLFYFSDICVARERFATHSPYNSLVGLPLYYAAQLVLAACAGWGR